MADTRDFYDVLGVSRTATEDEIRKAYRKLARQYHPDVNKSPDASKRFAEITEAYDALSDAEKRKQYDRFGHVPGAGVGTRSGHTGSAGGGWSYTTSGPTNVGDFDDVFAEFFGGRSPFGGPGAGAQPRSSSPTPQQGRHIESKLPITFLTAARGGVETVRMNTGSGSAQQIEVKIPAGIDDGAKLRLKGRGQPGQFGGPSGDLILTVEIGKHPYFRRAGLDLYIDVPISITEAALGTSVTVPLLDGTATLRIPNGSSSGQRLRLRGKGITDAGGRTGDFYAVLQVKGPTNLTERAESLLKELASELKNPRESAPWADGDE